MNVFAHRTIYWFHTNASILHLSTKLDTLWKLCQLFLWVLFIFWSIWTAFFWRLESSFLEHCLLFEFRVFAFIESPVVRFSNQKYESNGSEGNSCVNNKKYWSISNVCMPCRVFCTFNWDLLFCFVLFCFEIVLFIKRDQLRINAH